MLDWADQTPRPNLTQIENAVLRLRKQMGEQAAPAGLEAQDAQRPVPGSRGPTCQREMHYKDTKAQTVESRVGQLHVCRGLTIAGPARRVFFPLDEQLQLWGHPWSESVAKYAVWLSGLVTYEEAATILNTIGEIPISVSSVWRRVAVWGPHCQAVEATHRAASLAPPVPDLGAAMDGGMGHLRAEGWKELKVGSVFEIAV